MIEDNGKRFNHLPDWLALTRHGHLGLVRMQEWAEAIGVTPRLVPRPVGGGRLT
jgi:hypothetical protein